MAMNTVAPQNIRAVSTNSVDYFDTFQEALDYANKKNTVHEISFKLGNERLRLVKHEYPTTSEWVLEGTQGALDEATQKLSDNYHNHADEGR
jgi:hypothetical protein